MPANRFKYFDTVCPSCQSSFTTAGDISDIVSSMKPEVQIKELVKFPSFMPGAPCLNGNCSQGGYHKNPGYKDKLNKRCANCETLNGTNAKRCFACKSQDFYDDLLSDDELRDLGIDIPEQPMMGMGHHYHHHHGESAAGEADNED